MNFHGFRHVNKILIQLNKHVVPMALNQPRFPVFFPFCKTVLFLVKPCPAGTAMEITVEEDANAIN